MQVTPKYRKCDGQKQWVVDTRPKSIKKAAGQKGEQKPFGKDKAAAVAYAERINQAQRNGGAVTASVAGTIDALAEEFETRINKRIAGGNIVYKHGTGQVAQVKAFAQQIVRGDVRFGELKCVDVTVADIEELVGQMTQGYKTQKEYLRALKICLDYARQLGWAHWPKGENPAREFRHENNKHNVTVAEVEADDDSIERLDLSVIAELVSNAMAYDQPTLHNNGEVLLPAWCDGLALAFATTTGVAFGEHSALKWKYINFDEAEVKIYGANRVVGKGRVGFGYGKADARRRVIPIGPTMLQALREWKARSPRSGDDDYVFITRAGNVQVSSDNWRNRVLVDCGKRVIDECPHIRWHDLRHVYASILVEEQQPGKAIEDGWAEIARLMGHASIKTTFGYYVHWILNAEKNRQIGGAVERAVGL